MIPVSHTILAHVFEEHIKIFIWCSNDGNHWLDEAKDSVDESLEVMREHVLNHFYRHHGVTAYETVVRISGIALEKLEIGLKILFYTVVGLWNTYWKLIGGLSLIKFIVILIKFFCLSTYLKSEVFEEEKNLVKIKTISSNWKYVTDCYRYW